MENKKCSKCGEEKPATTEYFSRRKNSQDGFGRCKECVRQHNKKARDKRSSRKDDEIVIPIKKYCYGCHKVKSSDEFYRNKCQGDGLSSLCIKCCKKRFKEYRRKLKDRAELEIKVPLHKKCYICGKTRLSRFFNEDDSRQDGLSSCCKACFKEYISAWREKNQDKTLRYQESRKKERNLKAKERRKVDLNYRLKFVLSSRLRGALNRQSIQKTKKTMELIGCSIDFLRVHLKSKFSDGMTWNNYGKRGWHIDHIVPCAYFDLSDPEEQKKCFHYTNLQPLWAPDNLRKNSYYKGIRMSQIKLN